MTWKDKALDNEHAWGSQSIPVLLLLLTEEFGELVQAYTESVFEDGDPDRVIEELDDLMALGFQFKWRVESDDMYPENPRCGRCGYKIDFHRHAFEVDDDLGTVHDVCPIER